MKTGVTWAAILRVKEKAKLVLRSVHKESFEIIIQLVSRNTVKISQNTLKIDGSSFR